MAASAAADPTASVVVAIDAAAAPAATVVVDAAVAGARKKAEWALGSVWRGGQGAGADTGGTDICVVKTPRMEEPEVAPGARGVTSWCIIAITI